MARHTVSRKITDDELNHIIEIESAGNPRAKAGTSTATGLGQFLSGTWMGELAQHRPDLLKGRTKAQALALRTDPHIMLEILARFTEDNAQVLGPGYTPGDLYLAHFLGVGTARKFFRADPETSAAILAGPDAVRANKSILSGKTAGDVRAWATKKMRKKLGADWVAKYWTDAAIVEGETLVGDGKQDHEQQLVDAARCQNAAQERKDKIRAIQQRLETMEYFPGKIDGYYGGRTAGEITAFLNDIPQEIPFEAPKSEEEFWAVYPQIEELTLKYEPGFRRPKTAARKEATATDLSSAGNKTTNSNWWTRLVAKVQAIGAAIAGFFWVVVAKLSDNEFVRPIMEALSNVPDWAWVATGLAILGLVAGLVWKSTHSSDDGVVEDYQKGRLA